MQEQRVREKKESKKRESVYYNNYAVYYIY